MMKTACIISIVAALAACTPIIIQNEDSPHSRIPVGSSITLHQTLEIPRERTRVFLQDGRVMTLVGVNQYYPHCNFEVSSLSDGRARIEPDRFVVTGFRLSEDYVVQRPRPVRLASLTLADAGEDDGGTTPTTRAVHYRLHSERQPEVRLLSCYGGFADGWEVAYPSLSQIRQVLAGIVSLDDRPPPVR